MKKFLKISTLAVFMLAIALTAFAVADTGSDLAAGIVCPNVGWNTGNFIPNVGWNTGNSFQCETGIFASQDMQEFAYSGPVRIPYVGWNT